MPKASPKIVDFSFGELSPLALGNSDTQFYKNGLEVCENMLPTIQGACQSRFGSRRIASMKSNLSYTQALFTRQIVFKFNDDQTYSLEFGHEYIRFYRNRAQIESGGNPYEIASPYNYLAISGLTVAQKGDTLYIAHPNFPLKKLIRVADTNWSLLDAFLIDGPYLVANTLDSGIPSSVTLTPSAATGSVTLVASGAGSANFFTAGDVGRYIRMMQSGTWGWGRITAFTSGTTVTFQVDSSLTSTAGKTVWRLGTTCPKVGYYGFVGFHDERMLLLRHPYHISRVDFGFKASYENFSPTASDGVPSSVHAFDRNIAGSSDKVEKTCWAFSGEKGVIVGTEDGEWLLRTVENNSFDNNNVEVQFVSAIGSGSLVAPIRAGRSILFPTQARTQLYDLSYFYNDEGYRPNDISALADHIPAERIKCMALQKGVPTPTVWVVTDDGGLATVAFERNSNGVRAAWARHEIAGLTQALGSRQKLAFVTSVACIPSGRGGPDEVWLSVLRRSEDTLYTSIEAIYLDSTPFSQFDHVANRPQEFFNHLDFSRTYRHTSLVTDYGAGGSAGKTQITSPTHGLSNGSKIKFYGVNEALDGGSFTIENVATDTFEIEFPSAELVPNFEKQGSFDRYATVISGLGYLDGQSVTAVADGVLVEGLVPSSGSITLPFAATVVHVGLPYVARMKIPRLDAGSADGTAVGKIRRIHYVGIQIFRSLNLKYGQSFLNMFRVPFRPLNHPTDIAVPFFSGIKSLEFDGDYDLDSPLCIEQDQPFPLMIQGIYPQLVTQDRN